MIQAFNKATKKFADYFNYIEKELDKPSKEIEETIYMINNQIVYWEYDGGYTDDNFIQVFNKKFQKNYKIYNITSRQLEVKTDQDKIINLKAPDNPSYTLEFLMSFSIQAKKFLSSNPEHILIIHDDNQNGKIFSLLGCLLSYTVKENNSPIPPMDAYFNIISLNETFKSRHLKCDTKNQGRYLNYFSTVQNNPIISIKKYYLKSILINGAPAIENRENSNLTPYITINKNSYYAPVIRVISNGKVIYCSFKKDTPIQTINYSPDNAVKFDVDNLIFNDTLIEVLHKGEGKFKLLFVIQFNTFFIEDNAARFSKDQIDSINKDIRYPNEFFVDLLFDQTKDVDLSSYEEESIKWKSLLSEFILQGYQTKKTVEIPTPQIEEVKKEEKTKNEEEKKNEVMSSSISLKDEKEDEVGSSSTVNKVQELLQKIEGKEKIEDGDDEDAIDDYLSNLDKQAK